MFRSDVEETLLDPGGAGAGRHREHLLAARDRAVAQVCGSVTLALLLATFAYATTRYVVFGPWSPAHMPIYVLNKALAWTSLVLVGLALSLGPLARLWPRRFAAVVWQRKFYGLLGFGLASAHVLLSLMVFNYGYYRLLFTQAFELTWLAELAMSAGALSWLVLLLPAVLSIPSVQRDMSQLWWLKAQHAARLGLLLGAVHTFYGAPAWLTPATWHGGLPPITLLSTLAVAAVFALRLTARVWGRPFAPAGDPPGARSS